MKLEEIREALRSLGMAKALPREMRERVVMAFLAAGEVKRCQQGTTLFNQGDAHSERGYVLLKGSVSIEKDESPPAFCGPPEILGEMQQFNPVHERTATVRAEEESVLLAFSWPAFFKEAKAAMSEDELERLHEELGGVAWKHFVDTDEVV